MGGVKSAFNSRHPALTWAGRFGRELIFCLDGSHSIRRASAVEASSQASVVDGLLAETPNPLLDTVLLTPGRVDAVQQHLVCVQPELHAGVVGELL